MKTEDELKIRKFRKKLRQIENLERTDTVLSSDEELKIARKHELRSDLLELLSSCSQDGATSGPMTTALGQASEPDLSLERPEDDNWLFGQRSKVTIQEEDEQTDEKHEQGVTDEQKMKRLTNSASAPNLEETNITTSFPTAGGDNEASPRKKPKHQSQEQTKEQTNTQEEKHDQDTGTLEADTEQKTPNPLRQLQKHWLHSHWSVSKLLGHNDLVCDLAVWGRWLLTGSRDTTVKLWDLVQGSEVRSMGGHTGTVTSVIILQPQHATVIANELSLERPIDGDTCLGLSASLDCSIKVWNLTTGELLKSIYAYSPVTKLVFTYWKEQYYLVSGSSGGKVDLWDIASGTTLDSVRSNEDGVSGLQVCGDHVYSGSVDGVAIVYQIRGNKLHTIFVSENVKLASGSPLLWRHIRSLAIANEIIYYGDDAMNVKALDWRRGLAHKLSNHTTEFGTTDAIYVSSDPDLLLTSGYDLDNGIGFINIRHLPDEKYICSLCDEDTTRIVALGCTPSYPLGDGITIVTAGMELCVWKQVTKTEAPSDDSTNRAQYVPQFSRPARHSDVESETEPSEEDEDENDEDISQEVYNDGVSAPFSPRLSADNSQKGWLSSCCVL